MELLHGVMHGRTIELDTEPELPDGQPVTVVVRPEKVGLRNDGGTSSSSSLDRAFGSWAADAKELEEFLEWNRLQRRNGRAEITP